MPRPLPMTKHGTELTGTGGLSRRDLLRWTAAGAVVVGAGGMLAGCGGDKPGTNGAAGSLATALKGGTPTKGGQLRVGTITGGASESLDPLYGLSIQDSLRARQLYDGLFTVGNSA